MKKPKRSDDKYWTGTRNFDEHLYIDDLEDYYKAFADKHLQEYKENVLKILKRIEFDNPYGSYYDGISDAIQIINKTK